MATLFSDGLESFATTVEASAYSDSAAVIEAELRGKEHLFSIENPVSLLDVSKDDAELWFNWGADKAGFGSPECFREFCALAGVDPTQPIRCVDCRFFKPETTSFHFVSYDRPVTFAVRSNPLYHGYCHYFGCTGIRSGAKFLFEWFKEHGNHNGYCWNGRDFI